MRLQPITGKTTMSRIFVMFIVGLLLKRKLCQSQPMELMSGFLSEQRSILMVLFAAIHDGPWNDSADSLWGSNETVCAWRGVTCCLRESSRLSYSLSSFASGAQQSRPCSIEGEVRAINLDGLGLQGSIPDSLANLSGLEVLRLSNNPGLHSSLPPALLMRESLLEVDVRGTGMSCSSRKLACAPPSGFSESELLIPYKLESDTQEDKSGPLLQPPGATLLCSALTYRDWANSSGTGAALKSARILAAADLPPPGTTVVLASPAYWHFQFCRCSSVSGVGSAAGQPPILSWASVGRLQASCEAVSAHSNTAIPLRAFAGIVSAVTAFAVLALVLWIVHWRKHARQRSGSEAQRWARLQDIDADVPPTALSLRVSQVAAMTTTCGVQTDGGGRDSSNATASGERSQLDVLVAARRAKPPGSHRALFGPNVTLVATDVEGSTELWEWQPDIMNHALALHDRLMRITIANCYGYEITTEGDAFLVAFHEPVDAVRWALLLQSALLKLDWPPLLLEHPLCRPRPLVPVAPTGPASDPPLLVLFKGLAVRMGIATGVPSAVREHPVTRRMQYTGAVLRLATGIAELGSGGQVLVEPLTFKDIHNKFEELDVSESEVQQLAEVANSKAQAGSVARAQASSQGPDHPLAAPVDGDPSPTAPQDPPLVPRSATRPPPHMRQPSIRGRHVPPPCKSPTRVSHTIPALSEEPLNIQVPGLMPQPIPQSHASRARGAILTPPTIVPTVIHTSPATLPAVALAATQETFPPLKSTPTLLARRSRAPAQPYCNPMMDAHSNACNPGSSVLFTPDGSPAAVSGNSLAAAPAQTTTPQQQQFASSASTARSPQHAVMPAAGVLSSVQGSNEWLTTIHQGLMGYASNTGTMLHSINGSNTSRHSRPLGGLNPLDLAVMLSSRASADSVNPAVQQSQGSGAAAAPAFLFRSNLQGLFFRTVTADIPVILALSSQTSTEPGLHGSSTQAEADRLGQAARNAASPTIAPASIWRMDDSMDATLGVMPVAALRAGIPGIAGVTQQDASVYTAESKPPLSSASDPDNAVSARPEAAEGNLPPSIATTLPNGLISALGADGAALLAPLPAEAFGTDPDFLSSDGHLALAVTLQGGMWGAATNGASGLQRTTADSYRMGFGSSSNGPVGSRNVQVLVGPGGHSTGSRRTHGVELSLALCQEALAEPVLRLPPGLEPEAKLKDGAGLQEDLMRGRRVAAAGEQGCGPGPIAEALEDDRGDSSVQSAGATSAQEGAAGVRSHATAREADSPRLVSRRGAGESQGERLLARTAISLDIDLPAVDSPDGRPAGDDDEAFLDLLLTTNGSGVFHAVRAQGNSDGSSYQQSSSLGTIGARSGPSLTMAPRIPPKFSSATCGGLGSSITVQNNAATVPLASEGAETAPNDEHPSTLPSNSQLLHHPSTDVGSIASVSITSGPSPSLSYALAQISGASGMQSLSFAPGSSTIVSGEAVSRSSMSPESFSFAPVLKTQGSKQQGSTNEVERCLERMHALLGDGSRVSDDRRRVAATLAEGAGSAETVARGARIGSYALDGLVKEAAQPGPYRPVVRRSFSFIAAQSAAQQVEGSPALRTAPSVFKGARLANETGHFCPKLVPPPRRSDVGPAWLSLAVSFPPSLSSSAQSKPEDDGSLLGPTPIKRTSESAETTSVGVAGQKGSAPSTPTSSITPCTGATPGDLEPTRKPSGSDDVCSGIGGSGNYVASSQRSAASSQGHGHILGQNISQSVHRLASSTIASGSTSPVQLPSRAGVVNTSLTGTEDTISSQQRCILLPAVAPGPAPTSPVADRSSSTCEGHQAPTNKLFKALQPGNAALPVTRNNPVSLIEGAAPAEASTSRRPALATVGAPSPLSPALVNTGGNYAPFRLASVESSNGTVEERVTAERAALADRLGLRSGLSISVMGAIGRLPRSSILQAASSSHAGHRHPTLGALDLPELDADGRPQERFSSIGATEFNPAQSLHSGNLGALRAVGPRSLLLTATRRQTGGGGGRGLVLALRSAMMQEATGSGANLTAKIARDLASEDAADRVGPEESVPSRLTLQEHLKSNTEGSRQDLATESTSTILHSEVEPRAPVTSGSGAATAVPPASEGQQQPQQQQPTPRSGTASSRVRRTSLAPRTNEATGPALLRFVRHLPAYGQPIELAAPQNNRKGGGKAAGAEGGAALDGNGAALPCADGIGPPAATDLRSAEVQGVLCPRVAPRKASMTAKYRRRSAVEVRLASSGSSRHEFSTREAVRAATVADAGNGGGGGDAGPKDALHALVVIDMGVHRLNLPALGPAYGDVYDGVQVIQLLPAHLKHRAAYQPPLRSQAQLSPSFFDAPGAAQALLPCAPCTPPTFPRLSLMFIQPAGYSAVANANLEVAERSGAVFCAAVREVLHVFGAYECQEYECTFMVACTGPRAAAEAGLALHEWLLQADWPSDLLELNEGRLVMARDGRPVRRQGRGFRANVGIFTGVPLSVVPHATTGRADYFGALVNRAARLMAGAKAGQILLDKTAGLEVVREWRQFLIDAAFTANIVASQEYQSPTRLSGGATPPTDPAGEGTVVGSAPTNPNDSQLHPSPTTAATTSFGSCATPFVEPLTCSQAPTSTEAVGPTATQQVPPEQPAPACLTLPSLQCTLDIQTDPIWHPPSPGAPAAWWRGTGINHVQTRSLTGAVAGQNASALETADTAYVPGESHPRPELIMDTLPSQGVVEGVGSPGRRLWSASARMLVERRLAEVAANELSASAKANIVPMLVQVLDLGTYQLKGLSEDQAVVAVQLKPSGPDMAALGADGSVRVGEEAQRAMEEAAAGMGKKAALVQPGKGLMDELCVALPAPLTAG